MKQLVTTLIQIIIMFLLMIWALFIIDILIIQVKSYLQESSIIAKSHVEVTVLGL